MYVFYAFKLLYFIHLFQFFHNIFLYCSRCKTFSVINDRLIVRYMTCKDAWPPYWNQCSCCPWEFRSSGITWFPLSEWVSSLVMTYILAVKNFYLRDFCKSKKSKRPIIFPVAIVTFPYMQIPFKKYEYISNPQLWVN